MPIGSGADVEQLTAVGYLPEMGAMNMDEAVEQIQQALDLVNSVQVLEGTDKDDVERLLESALARLKSV